MKLSVDETSGRLGDPIGEGEWQGWSKWTGDEPFEDAVGPFFARRADDGGMIAACRMHERSLRSGGIAHGGLLMSFADYSLFMIAHDEINGQAAVTVSMTSEFLAAAPAGSLLVARGDVLKKGRSLLFVRGIVSAGDTDVLAFTAVVKLVRAIQA